MNGYVGRHKGLRASLYLELVPREFLKEATSNPCWTSEANVLGLTAKITAAGIRAVRYRSLEQKKQEEEALAASKKRKRQGTKLDVKRVSKFF